MLPFPVPGGFPPFYLLLLLLPLASVILRRVPVLGPLVSFASWIGILALLVVVLGQRERFDPYLGRIATYLHLDDQQVVGKEVRIRMATDGHFWVRARINGVERRMLVDSGATVTGLSVETAAAAGLTVHDSVVPVILKTANGMVTARTARVQDLELGDIRARALGVVVSPAFGNMDVLGMNFLSRLKSWRVEGGTLILVPHHPESGAAASASG